MGFHPLQGRSPEGQERPAAPELVSWRILRWKDRDAEREDTSQGQLDSERQVTSGHLGGQLCPLPAPTSWCLSCLNVNVSGSVTKYCIVC
jgi:hypothetical protein